MSKRTNGKAIRPKRPEDEDIKNVLLFLLQTHLRHSADLTILQNVVEEHNLLPGGNYNDLRQKTMLHLAEQASQLAEVRDNALLADMLRVIADAFRES